MGDGLKSPRGEDGPSKNGFVSWYVFHLFAALQAYFYSLVIWVQLAF